MNDEQNTATAEATPGKIVDENGWPIGSKWKVQVYIGGVVKNVFEGPAEEAVKKYDERCETHKRGTLVLIDPDGQIREQKVRAFIRPTVKDDGSVEWPDTQLVDEKPDPVLPETVKKQRGPNVEAHDVLQAPSSSTVNLFESIESIDKAISRLRTAISVLESRRGMFVKRLAAQNDIGPVRSTVAWAMEALKESVS